MQTHLHIHNHTPFFLASVESIPHVHVHAIYPPCRVPENLFCVHDNVAFSKKTRNNARHRSVPHCTARYLVSARPIFCRQCRQLALLVGLFSQYTSFRSITRYAIHSLVCTRLCTLPYGKQTTHTKKRNHAATCGHMRFFKNVSQLTFF